VIGWAFDEADRRDPQHVHQRVALVDGNKTQIAAILEHAQQRNLTVPIFIDYVHVAEYLRKAAVALNPGKTPAEISEWGDGQLLRILHGRAKAVAATLASLAAKIRNAPRGRGADLGDVDRAVTYLTNSHPYMRYDKALARGWPIATGMIEGACRHIIEDRFGVTGARWGLQGGPGHPEPAHHRDQWRPGRLHGLLQTAHPRRAPPRPLRRRLHPRPRAHRQTISPSNERPECPGMTHPQKRRTPHSRLYTGHGAAAGTAVVGRAAEPECGTYVAQSCTVSHHGESAVSEPR
jgi:hypothetical protein